MSEVSSLDTTTTLTSGSYLVGVASTGTTGIPANLYTLASVFSVGLEASSSLPGTITLASTDVAPVSHGGSVYLATLAAMVSAGGGGGGGGSPTVTDGTHTVTGAGTITFSGATVSGSTPSATVTVSGGGSSGLPGYQRPALSAFTASSSSTLITATDYTNGPISVVHQPGTSPTAATWSKSVSGSEWMLTARIAQRAFQNDLNTYGPLFGVGTSNSGGTVALLGMARVQGYLGLFTYSSLAGGYTSDYTYNDTFLSGPFWVRIYYQASNSSFPFQLYFSDDGYAWDLMYQWNSTSGLSAAFGTPTNVLFLSDQNGGSGVRGGSILNFNVVTGTGSSLNPYLVDTGAL